MSFQCSGWLVTALLFVVPLSNQEVKRPDFSGTWVAVSPGDNLELTIKQTTKTLETQGSSKGVQGQRTVYNLDGSESRNSVELLGHTIVTVSRVNWKSDQLIISSSTTLPDGSKGESVNTWSLDAKGQLVMEGTEKGTQADGRAGVSGKLHIVLRRK